jgi:hypothetical protein
MPYSWLQFAAARQQLAARLADSTDQFWVDVENGIYIQEALRTWNAITFSWKIPFSFTIAAASQPEWYSLGSIPNSLRLRTVTDSALYTVMEYHLLEPPSGGTWTGTTQFSIADLSLALQRCRDEAIQVANCNQANPTPIETVPGNTINALPDTFLDVARAQWVPAVGDVVTLVRTDKTALNFYQTAYMQTPPSAPTQYDIATVPPLTLQVDIAPVQEGAYDLIALLAGPALAPPTPSLLNVPDDSAWVLKWGALADLLGRESEATDLLRASYCKKRYMDGLALMQATPWVMDVMINNVPGNIVSITGMDRYNVNWDLNPPDFQTIIIGGTDFFTVVPDPSGPMSITMLVLANAPIPVLDTDYVQVTRDSWDAILDYAQFLAMFKQGGQEFMQAMPLEQNFFKEAMKINGRLEELGLFANLYYDEGTRELRAQERFEKEE